MNKVYALAPHEDWIVDRFVKEWNEDNADITVMDVHDADVIWLMADWCWTALPGYVLYRRKVITTVHHVVPEKFGPAQEAEFRQRDRYTTVYHVPNKHTEAFIRPLTQKPIHVIPYWANQKIWRTTGTKAELRKKHGLPELGFFIGSFQRDTEGHDLITPKLEKGPDLLANYIVKEWEEWKTYGDPSDMIHVVLGGWRRQYIISRLEAAGVPYTYFEKPTQEVINELYQTLDLYPVTARQEGGPQSLIECGLLDIPCVSRDIGIASAVIPAYAINDDPYQAVSAVPDVEHLKLPNGYKPYRNLIESL